MPIDGTAPSDEEPKGPNAPPGTLNPGTLSPWATVSPAAKAVAIPSDEEIANLGSHGRDAYGKITGKILSQSKASDLGDMSAKLTELVSLSKGFKPDAAKHGLLERAIGLLRNEREQVLAHTETVQRRVDTMVGELDKIADRQRDRARDMAALQGENLAYLDGLKADAAQAKDWLSAVEAARKIPLDQADAGAAAKASALQRARERLQGAINNLENAMTLARQQAIEIQMTEDNSAAILEEFTRTKTVVIPALQSVLAQYLVGLEQKNAVATDSMLRDTLAEAMKQNAALTGENSVRIAGLEQKSMISVQTMEECQTLLEGAASRIREIEEAGRQQRIQDAARRTELERRMIASVQH
ncbi:MAG: toxic anion resistance protein [Acetobacteraceae bacterium]